jgi:hypothetical protein
VLWGAVSEGPNGYTTAGTLDEMKLCPANRVDTFQKFNGNNGAYNPSVEALYQDNRQSYSTTAGNRSECDFLSDVRVADGGESGELGCGNSIAPGSSQNRKNRIN